MKPIALLLTAVLFGFASIASAEETAQKLRLWPSDSMPGPAAATDGEERDLTKDEDRLIAGKRIIKLGHVSSPEIHVYLPPAEKANGTAVVVCPGGGFSILAWDLEGTEVATWLNELGIAAVVLKYRVPTRHHEETEGVAPAKALGPMMDAQRALSLTRANAKTWTISPDKVGILGFSAGGQTAALAAVAKGDRAYPPIDESDQFSCQADFALLIYPGGLVDQETGDLLPYYPVDEDTPPMFFAHAADDRVTALSSTALFTELKKNSIPAEVHIFARGGHGYGLRPTEFPVTRWPKLASDWMREMDLLKRSDEDHSTGSGHASNPVGSERNQQLLAFAKKAARAWEEGDGLPQLSTALPHTTLAEAELVQKAYVESLLQKKTFAGIKGAVVGEGAQRVSQLNGPLSAVLFTEGRKEGSEKPVIPIRPGTHPWVETELGIIFAKPIRKKISSVEELKTKVRAVVPVVELPAGKHDWQPNSGAFDFVAANVDSDFYIVGAETRDLSVDLDALPIELFFGETLINLAAGGHARNGQWWNFLHQVNWAVENGYPLEPGHLVITGALGNICKEGAGNYRATFGELGAIEFSLSE